jgi:hypothetical protein
MRSNNQKNFQWASLFYIGTTNYVVYSKDCINKVNGRAGHNFRGPLSVDPLIDETALIFHL